LKALADNPVFRKMQSSDAIMCKFCLLVTLLLIAAFPLAGPAQEAARAEAVQQDAPATSPTTLAATPPARRPKLPGVITFESELGDVLFPHKVHQKMGCSNCHHQIHAKTLDTPHEEYLGYSWVNCGDCHDADTAISTSYYGCDHCHHSNLENIADETLTAKVVIHKSCWNCHLSGNGAEASERCSFCHQTKEQALEVSQETAGQ
jgi:c(7)-type cytochrome triheme protein